MKIILRNVNLLHPEQKLNKKNIDVLITDGVITKIGKLSEDEVKGSKEFDLKK